MNGIVLGFVALAGGCGAACRFGLDVVISQRIPGQFPFGTILVNVSGSFVLGFVTGVTAGGLLPSEWALIVGTGFLGGYTTFSTATFETVRLAQQGKWALALHNGIGALVYCSVMAGLGLWVGSLI